LEIGANFSAKVGAIQVELKNNSVN
jgi:hypothetical protein